MRAVQQETLLVGEGVVAPHVPENVFQDGGEHGGPQVRFRVVCVLELFVHGQAPTGLELRGHAEQARFVGHEVRDVRMQLAAFVSVCARGATFVVLEVPTHEHRGRVLVCAVLDHADRSVDGLLL